MYENITVERKGAIAVLTVNRPKAMNALNLQTMQEIEQALASLAADKSVGVLVITGNGEKAFVAGADIGYMVDLSPIQGKEWGRKGQTVFSMVENFPRPVIAAVNGFALGGGCELAMACDIRIASDNARFGQPEVSLGIIPGFAGTQRLSRLVGKGYAKMLIYSGDMIDAQEALRIGLVQKVVPLADLMTVVEDLAGRILSKGPLAVAYAKQAINQGIEMGAEQGFAFEAEIFGMLFSTADQKEGMKAFLEKRKPAFKGE